jgi:iron complex outermembrane receptor protein
VLEATAALFVLPRIKLQKKIKILGKMARLLLFLTDAWTKQAKAKRKVTINMKWNHNAKFTPSLAWVFSLVCLFRWADVIRAAETDGIVASPSELTTWSIEKLLDAPVTIMRGHETVSQTPAAVSVVTQEDIRRSGATTLPEALRLVPGLDVAQVDAHQWAVSARGFNDVFANKLLVLQDGRSIYTPLFSGVLWDVQGTLMEDIERIEVVRGPGASLWGANAVNGVINIISRSAENTQGLLLTGAGGEQDRGMFGARYGGQITSNSFFRVYGTYFNHDDTVLPNGDEAPNHWQIARFGFRTDWRPSEQNLITFQGDGYAGWIHQVFGTFQPTNPATFTDWVKDEMQARGGNLLGRWTHTFSDTSELRAQVYYDRTEREATILNEKRDSFDLDLQEEFALGDRNRIVCGLGYRLDSDEQKNNSTIAFHPERQTVSLFSAFAEDELALVRDKLSLTLGSKFEHNDYTGFEIEPGARLLWSPWKHQTFWASISRAVRTPSRAEEDILLNQGHPVAPGVVAPTTTYGNENFKSEELTAYEFGYRSQVGAGVSFDLAAFYNNYDKLRSSETGPSPTQPVATPFIPLHLSNKLRGETYGAEVSATWKVTGNWRLQPSYTFLEMQLRNGDHSTDTASAALLEGESPRHQAVLRSSLDLPHGIELDAALRYVDSLPSLHVDSYVTVDARLAWQINPNWEVAIVGQNLVQDHHAEFAPTSIQTQPTEIPRTIYGKITWRF